jgi:hypothetical protein
MSSKVVILRSVFLVSLLLLTSGAFALEPAVAPDSAPSLNMAADSSPNQVMGGESLPVQSGFGADEQASCLAWNIAGYWRYEASGGGKGSMNLTQDAVGVLKGSWHNEANGARGIFTIGAIVGVSFGLHSDSGEDLQGVVSADGTRLSGQITGATRGTFFATGQATCLVTQPPPKPGDGEITVAWGDYRFRSGIETEATSAGVKASRRVQVTRIDTPNGVVLTIQLVLYGEDMPGSIAMTQQVGGGEENPGGVLYRDVDRSTEFRHVYVRTITLAPTGLTPQNPTKTTTIRAIDPRYGRRFRIAIVNQRLIDPAGIVYDQVTSDPIVGAMCFLYKQDGSTWVLWDAENYGQSNPLPTDNTGHYAWLTDQGSFRVECFAKGYADGAGGPVTVPPPVLDLHIGMDPTSRPMPSVSEVTLTGIDGLPRTSFVGGQQLQAQVIISNTQSTDIKVDIEWTTTDPTGKVVAGLSGKKPYSIGQFPVVARLDGTVPASSKGTYTYRVKVSQSGQTVFRGTTFSLEESYKVMLPLIMERRTVAPPGWTTIMQEGFEGAWPSAGWEAFDNTGSGDGEYYPARRSCRAFEGTRSLWMIGG